MKFIERMIAFSLVAMLMLASVPLGESGEVIDETKGNAEGWSEDVRLTNNTRPDTRPSIAAFNSIVHIVWQYQDIGFDDVYYVNSTDSGQNWNVPSRVSSGTSGIYAQTPDIAISGDNISVVWSDNNSTAREIRYRRSPDGGQSWLPEQMISADDGYNSEAPKIAVSEDGMGIHVVWIDSRHGDESWPPNTELYYNRSLDGGVTWEGEVRLTNAPKASASHDLAVNGSNVHVIWTDGRSDNWEVYYMVSRDNGLTWQDGQESYGSDLCLTTNTTSHSEPTIAVNDSTIHVAWVDTLPGPIYYMYYRNSTNNGLSWNPIVLLSGPSSLINKPDMCVWNDNVHLVWGDKKDGGTGREIYYKNSSDAGVSWSPDLRLTYLENYESVWPRIAHDDSTVHISWYDNRDSNYEIYYKRFPDFPSDSTPPDVSYVTPPTPPDDSTYAVGQKAFARVHYYDNESAASNATLFWKNSTGTWNWKPMDNISYWSGSHNNYFEANFTEHSPSTVIYYVNCTSAAGLTTTTPPRTLNFDNSTIHDPYPIYGFVRLYDGNGGAYTPIPMANAPIEVTWWDISLNNWNTISANADVNGQYTVDLMNYMNGTVVFCNATAPGYGNNGYNWTFIDVIGEPGGRQQDIVCGVPYDLVLVNYPLATPVNSPFGITYEIRDIDGILCQGYYSFSDGPVNISANGSYSAPADYSFNGVASATPGVRAETVTMGLPLGARWLNVSEGPDLNPYLTPWGAFYHYDGTPGFVKDWDNVTITVTGEGFLWRLEHGWNLISVPADPVYKGSNGVFDAHDALQLCFAITGDAGMVMANRTGASTYAVIDMGVPENAAFRMNGVKGYWLYLDVPGPFIVNVTAQNYTAAGANVIDLVAGWNLLGFTHNISAGGAQPGGWNIQPTASHFTTGLISPGLDVPPRTKIVVTRWDPLAQWYYSYVHTPTFEMPSRDWAYDTTYAYGYYVWADAPVTVNFDTEY